MTTIDRRKVLKGAAAIGTAAWTAPFIASTAASAQTSCTPKCSPTVGNVAFSWERICNTAAGGNNVRQLILRFLPTGLCPCGDPTPDSPITSIISQPTWNGGNLQAGITVTGNQVTLAGLDNGPYSQTIGIDTPIRVRISNCFDKDGTSAVTIIEYRVSWTVTGQGNGGCSAVSFLISNGPIATAGTVQTCSA
jgi:hypothetical protein